MKALSAPKTKRGKKKKKVKKKVPKISNNIIEGKKVNGWKPEYFFQIIMKRLEIDLIKFEKQAKCFRYHASLF